jgi:hypothetical protein
MFLFRLARALLILSAILFAGLGTFALWRPVQTLTPLGFEVKTIDARTEVRATYGGLQLALALIFAVTGRSQKTWLGGIAVLSAVTTGFLLGRGVGYLVDGPPGRWTVFLAACELSMWLPASFILLVQMHLIPDDPPK